LKAQFILKVILSSFWRVLHFSISHIEFCSEKRIVIIFRPCILLFRRAFYAYTSFPL